MPPPSIVEILRQRDPVEQRIAPDAQHDVRNHEVEGRVPVPAMPDGQAVEADEPLEPGKPCERTTWTSAA
jgi:hypothetical protein